MMFFDGWFGVLRVLIVGVLAYVGLVVLLRISGKRTLSKMNAFDLVVTAALGSTLANVLLSSDVSLAEGLAAFGLLIGCQFALTWLSVRRRWVEKLVKASPTLLVHHGRRDERAMREQRVTAADVDAALRQHGLGEAATASVVLENDGSLTVLRDAGDGAEQHQPRDGASE